MEAEERIGGWLPDAETRLAWLEVGNMCNFWSCVLTREGKVLWDKDKTSHEDIIKKHRLKDDRLEDRDFVRLEISPKDIRSKRKSDWVYKVDEEGTLPKWYSANPKHQEAIVWKEWEIAMRQTLWKFDFSVVDEVVKEVKAIPYLKFNGKEKKEWHLSIRKDLGEARDAAWDAAKDAAKDAAWSAAWDAAKDAAGDAAGDARLYGMIKLCLKTGAKIGKKHIKHAEDRMDVWRAGYALLCDVNGKLYVYGVRKD